MDVRQSSLVGVARFFFLEGLCFCPWDWSGKASASGTWLSGLSVNGVSGEKREVLNVLLVVALGGVGRISAESFRLMTDFWEQVVSTTDCCDEIAASGSLWSLLSSLCSGIHLTAGNNQAPNIARGTEGCVPCLCGGWELCLG